MWSKVVVVHTFEVAMSGIISVHRLILYAWHVDEAGNNKQAQELHD